MDFDKNGIVRALGVPEDPAPLAWAYGLPFIFIERRGTPLIKKQHAGKLANRVAKTDSVLKEH